jgi:hypothetical protein
MEAVRAQVAPVDKAAIEAFHSGGGDYSGPPAVAPGSVFTEGARKGPSLQGVPVMWRSREGGLLQADLWGDQEDGDDVLWALKDHVRTKARKSTFSASQERNIASQHDLLNDMLKVLQDMSLQKSVAEPECSGTSSTSWALHAACVGPPPGSGLQQCGGQNVDKIELLHETEPSRRRRSCWPFIFSLSSTRMLRRCNRVDSASDLADLWPANKHKQST